MKPRRRSRPLPPKIEKRSTLTSRTAHSTIPNESLESFAKPPLKAKTPPLPPKGARPTGRRVARIVEDQEASLLDLLDNLLDKGVVLNADLILALANVDLVYIRLAALICAADRVLPHARGRSVRQGG
jgi:hypothetical protein